MKKVILKSLSITNFKGIKNLELSDLSSVTNIYGDNATGKTTIFDAFIWLLFDKDSSDRSTFEIKPLDENNNVIPKTENEVSAVLLIDGKPLPLKKIHKEKWVKKKGSIEAEFTGNETLYYWDDVPVKRNEYKTNIEGIISEEVFKLITSPTAFNSLKWQDQRQMLVSLTNITDESIANSDPDFKELFSKLSETKTIDKYERQIKSSISDSKKKIKELPTRIDEVERGKPEAFDFNALEKELEVKLSEKSNIDKQIKSKLEAEKTVLEKQSEVQQKLFDIDRQVLKIQNDLKKKAIQEANAKNEVLNSYDQKLSKIVSNLEDYNKGISRYNSRLNELTEDYKRIDDEISKTRDEWIKWNAKEFELEEGQTACPTCSREFEKDKIEQIVNQAKESFESIKNSSLSRLNEKGTRLKNELESIKNEFSDIEKRLEKGYNLINELEAEKKLLDENKKKHLKADPEVIYKNLLNSNTDITNLEKQYSILEEYLNSFETQDVKDLEQLSLNIGLEIDSLKNKLNNKLLIENANKRIKEIESEESSLAKVILDYERELHIIERFTEEKINRLEAAINEKFKYVKFKLFEKQVNGAEVPTCKSMVNGVPYSDVNTAGRINAGLDIINTLTDHYGVIAPIFIDNRESVSETIETDSQIINLIVKKGQKELEVK